MQLFFLFLLVAFHSSHAADFQMDSMHVEVPHLALLDASGKSEQLGDFPKPLLLHFWASWCTGCRKEIPELEKLAAPTLAFWQASDDANTKKLSIYYIPYLIPYRMQ